MYTQEIYLRPKSKDEILKPPSQGSIWKANGAKVRSMCFHTSASSSGEPWDGSSWQWQERGSKAASSKPMCCFQPYFWWHHTMGQHQAYKLLFKPAFPFLFSKRLWRPFTMNKAGFSDAGYIRTDVTLPSFLKVWNSSWATLTSYLLV